MIPGDPQILTCPHCGGKKEVMSLVSGNTCGAEYWSDNKQIAPMLPEISYVQKCPHCGKYYIMDRQKVEYAKEGWCSERGILTFPEMKEAYKQLCEEGLQNEGEERVLRTMLHHAFNDYYYRSNDVRKNIIEEDRSLFHDNGLWLIENLITDNLLKAEFYREIGEMDKAQTFLDTVNTKSDFQKKIVSVIQKKINNNDSSVFRIQ